MKNIHEFFFRYRLLPSPSNNTNNTYSRSLTHQTIHMPHSCPWLGMGGVNSHLKKRISAICLQVFIFSFSLKTNNNSVEKKNNNNNNVFAITNNKNVYSIQTQRQDSLDFSLFTSKHIHRIAHLCTASMNEPNGT